MGTLLLGSVPMLLWRICVPCLGRVVVRIAVWGEEMAMILPTVTNSYCYKREPEIDPTAPPFTRAWMSMMRFTST